MELKEMLREIKTQLRLSMNGVASQSMREKGLDYKLNFGVELPRIRQIASQFEKNHELAQALWKENVRESKILAGLLQPVETFYPEIADIWVEDMPNMEIAELTCMNLFQHLPYAPAKSLQWIASEQEFAQVCGFETAARLLARKGEMDERAAGELLDQAFATALSGTARARKSALLVVRRYMQHSQEQAFLVCRMAEPLREADREAEKMLYEMVRQEALAWE